MNENLQIVVAGTVAIDDVSQRRNEELSHFLSHVRFQNVLDVLQNFDTGLVQQDTGGCDPHLEVLTTVP